MTKLRVGRIPYLNTDPFFAGWDGADAFSLLSATPRELGRLAREGALDAGPMSVIDLWSLEGEFEPLGSLGIAVRSAAKSVLLFSKKPIGQLEGARIGVTDQTSTSVRLLESLLQGCYGIRTARLEAFSSADDARLLIGDEALRASSQSLDGFPHVADLGEEWKAWKRRPFVFARWAVRRTVPPLKQELAEALEKSLRRFETGLGDVVSQGARRLGLPERAVKDYFKAITFRLDEPELAAADHFREIITGKASRCLC